MNYLYIDIETYSAIPIDCGVYKYVTKAELLLLAYAYNNGPVKIWDCTTTSMPSDLSALLHDPNLIWVAHNSQFERVIIENILQIRPTAWIDTMVLAYQHGLPGALSTLCDIFKLTKSEAKDKRGKYLIDLFCKPLGKNRKLKRATKDTHSNEWQEFIDYNISDVNAMRIIHKKLPKWNFTEYEYKLWLLDQKINERGLCIDIDLVNSAIQAIDKAKIDNTKLITKLTKGIVTAGTQNARLQKYIKDTYKITMPNMQASTVQNYADSKNTPEEVKRLLRIRQDTSKSSTAKYIALKNSTNNDNRIRGNLQFCGAFKTGRWAGRNFQPQNLPRPLFSNEIIEDSIKLLKKGELKENIPSLCSSMLRGTVIAPPGKKLIVPDYKSIEGRTLAWLAGEDKKVKAYMEVDKGNGFDMYVLTFANTFKIEPKDVTKNQRQLGKPIELAFGYQGGVGAFLKFASSYNINLQSVADNVQIPPHLYAQAEQWYYKSGSDLDIDIFIAIDGIKRMWRQNNPNIVQYWYDVENAAKMAIRGCKSYVGNCVFDTCKNWLRIRLPSGRYLSYPKAEIIDDQIYYYHGKFGTVSTYGGALVENITQAVARDVLASGMFLAEKHNYKIVLTVHDEIVAETPDTNQYTLLSLINIIAQLPCWASGLPMPADGFEGYRYKKAD